MPNFSKIVDAKKHISIKAIFIAFPIVLGLLVVFPGAYFLYRSAIDIGEAHAYERLDWEAERIFAYVRQVVNIVEHVNTGNAEVISKGIVNYRSQEILQRYFLANLRESSFFSSIYFGNTAGGLADAGRDADTGQYYWIGTDNFAAGTFTKTALDEDGEPSKILQEFSGFDARERDWYQNALTAQKSVWSEPYLLFTGQDMAITNSKPVYAADGSLLGVTAIELFLSDLSSFLADQVVMNSYNGQSLLLGRDGLLIATSQYPVLVSVSEDEYRRQNINEISAPEIQALLNYLENVEIDLQTLNEAQHFTIATAEERYLVAIQPLEGVEELGWLSIVIYPEEEFIADIVRQRQTTIYVFIIVAILIAALMLHLSHLILHPLNRLKNNMQQLDFANPEVTEPVASFEEINELGLAFHELTSRLQRALQEVQQEIDDHQRSKERLRLSEARYRSVVEDAPGLLCSFTPDGKISFANRAYAELHGMTATEIIGVNFQGFVHETDREAVMNEIYALDSEKPINSLIQRTYLPTGEIHYQRWINRAIFSVDGEVVGYQAFGEDVQEEHKIQQAQSALYRIWQAANRVSSLDELYPAIHRIIQEVIPLQNLIIALYDEENERLFPCYFVDEHDVPPAYEASIHGPSAYVMETKASLLCTPAEFFALNPELKSEDIHGAAPKIWLGVPLMLDTKVIGIIASQDYKSETALGDDEREFFEMLSPSIAATIARHHAAAELNRYARTNALLFKASAFINQALETENLYQALYGFLREVMACDTLIISDYVPAAQTILCAFLIQDGHKQDVQKYPPLPLEPDNQSTQSHVILTKKARLINDYLAEQHTAHRTDEAGKLHKLAPAERKDENAIRSALIVPLLFRGEVSGVIQVMSKKKDAYRMDDLHLLETLSTQIDIARNNIGLYEKAQAEIAMRKKAEDDLRVLNAQLEERINLSTKELSERIATVENLNMGMSNILKDLNIARKKAELKSQELHETNAELEAFTYSVTHDLRAPLRHIQKFSDILYKSLDTRLSEREDHYFQNVFTASEKMEMLIQDMLVLSRAGRRDLRIKRVDMNKIIEDVRANLLDQVEGRVLKWKIATLPTVEADAGLLDIVWTNLIENAIKYTRPRTETHIEINTLPPDDPEAIPEQYVFFIRDNGVGFNDTYIDNLFGVFQRLHQAEAFEGNGIGLATVRRIILRHGGRVWAKSVLDEGATFYFSLPIRVQSNH